MVKNILIIGGGIIGLCSAYYLSKEGHNVTIIEKGNGNEGASFVNAGYITPSHIIPLAAPGMIAQGIKMMFNSASPFYMKPRLETDFLKWSWFFHRSSTKKNVEKAIPLIKEINLMSRDLFADIRESGDLGEFQLERKGLLMMYQTQKSFLHEKKVAEKASALGLEVSYLDRTQLGKLQPNVRLNAEGAIHYECDGHTTPNEIMPKLLQFLKDKGVTICMGEEVMDLAMNNGQIQTVKTQKNTYVADEVILAAGAWSGALSKKLNLKLPIQGGKGYSINVERKTGITIPAILMEPKMAVTPMNGFTRFAGTMEFSGNNTMVRKERVTALVNGAESYYPDLRINEEELSKVKTGLRPVSPDGLPYIGKTRHIKNLTIATGHAMMGWSLGPATGKLVSEIIEERKTSMAIEAFSPDRRF
ncbi:FAD-dependent oxidoreductase [Maribacter confluentis]|uniref:FAD-dependent oxidoreductase n=1 Tax=Maribacter confluentis TaxID=1656093 RepID=A0ABT8RTA3_9FLAO|nr:FAD-dependent oxidoreductase [Maribacter confluentis]MDO1514134.1 FAD-dependent oxidoreductase [Maribacter confluentis]